MNNFANHFQIVGRAAREPMFYSTARKNVTKVLCPLFLMDQRDSTGTFPGRTAGAPSAVVTSPVSVEAFFKDGEGNDWRKVHTGDLVIVNGHCETWCFPDRETGEAQYRLALVADEVSLLENWEVRSARRKKRMEQRPADPSPEDAEEKTA